MGPMESFDVSTPLNSWRQPVLPATECSYCARTRRVAAASPLTALRCAEWERFTRSACAGMPSAGSASDPHRAARLQHAHRGRRGWQPPGAVWLPGTDNVLWQKTADGARWVQSARIGGNLTGGVCAVCPPAPSKTARFHRGSGWHQLLERRQQNADWVPVGPAGRHAICGRRRRPTAMGCLLSLDGTGALYPTYWWNGAWVRGSPFGQADHGTAPLRRRRSLVERRQHAGHRPRSVRYAVGEVQPQSRWG